MPDLLRERKPMRTAVLLSLLMHALVLSLSFGSEGLGLPGLDLPWRERRFEADDLHVTLLPTPTWVEPSAVPPTAATVMPLPKAAMDVTEEVAVKAPAPIPAPALIATEQSDTATLAVPPAPAVPPPPAIAAVPTARSPEPVASAPQDAGDATKKQAELEARERSMELARLEREKQEEKQRDEKKQEEKRQDERRQEEKRAEEQKQADLAEAARQAATRQETERLQAERLEAARQVAARKEAARLEAERMEAAKQAVARQEADRVEAVRMEGERQTAARQEAARSEKAAKDAERAQDDARRDAVRRAMGKQLDEEAARREAATRAERPSSTLPLSVSSPRRGRLFGHTDANAEFVLYSQAWSRKIQLNMTFDMVREAAKQPHAHPLVTVAIRSDGSVESVTFVTSSGVPAIDEAVRRIVQSQAPYPAFAPALAREYDVIEIRRTWHFDMAVRLF
jgi:TonB family protein